MLEVMINFIQIINFHLIPSSNHLILSIPGDPVWHTHNSHPIIQISCYQASHIQGSTLISRSRATCAAPLWGSSYRSSSTFQWSVVEPGKVITSHENWTDLKSAEFIWIQSMLISFQITWNQKELTSGHCQHPAEPLRVSTHPWEHAPSRATAQLSDTAALHVLADHGGAGCHGLGFPETL